ncbi:hypothetical protein [Candidatus Phytoplasma meliae]|uniref:Uncharacterized protein n=1 Tax=Candidatus Phytoplasma meliae TaxID=1848402 RepID=A0ABS5CYL2_9MOLU|nr:hypothetical protein [Candidatus Phytoplasma meliae]MBP5836064.1 hypothetical protein [Candidatus Phytoplasma meliae]
MNIKSLPNDPNQEEITLYYRRYKLWRFIFDHKLSHNPEIRIMQQKLIRKKELFQKISNISVNMAFIMMIVPELVIRKNYFNIPSSRISNYEFVITCILSSLSLIIIFSGLMFYKTIIQKNVLDKKDQSNTEIQDNSIYEKNQKNLISNNEEK